MSQCLSGVAKNRGLLIDVLMTFYVTLISLVQVSKQQLLELTLDLHILFLGC